MKQLVRTVLGGNPPGQSRAERRFRSQYHLVVSSEMWADGERWTGQLKKDKHNTVQTFRGKTEAEIREQAKASVDLLWQRYNKPAERRHRV